MPSFVFFFVDSTFKICYLNKIIYFSTDSVLSVTDSQAYYVTPSIVLLHNLVLIKIIVPEAGA